MAARGGFEPATFRAQGIEPTTEPPRSTMFMRYDNGVIAVILKDFKNLFNIEIEHDILETTVTSINTLRYSNVLWFSAS